MSTACVIPKSPPLHLALRRRPLPFPFDAPGTVLTHNGRFAIRDGLRALSLPAGGRILMPAWHCGSETDAVLAAGGQVSLYRTGRDLRADLDEIRARLRQGGIWGLYAIHYFGYPQPSKALAALAKEYGAVLIEDLALGLFSKDSNGAWLGSQGDMSVFSLVKTLPLPDGGALWLNPSRAAERRPPGPWPVKAALSGMKGLARRSFYPAKLATDAEEEAAREAWHARSGIGATDLCGGISPFSKLLLTRVDADRAIRLHRRNYTALHEGVPRKAGMRPLLPTLPEGACPAFFPLYTPEAPRVHAALQAEGIQSVRFWRQRHPAAPLDGFPEVLDLKRNVLRLPVHGGIGPEAVQRICRVLDQVCRVR